MEKSFWGPATWHMIHAVAAGYKPEYRTAFKTFIGSLPFLLPCEYCRQHVQQNISVLPLTDNVLSSADNLFLWSYSLHDLVNHQLKKPPSPSYILVKKYYFDNIKNPSFWGPSVWRVIHSFAASYRSIQPVSNAYMEFIYSLGGILPCADCRDNYRTALSTMPLTFATLLNAHSVFLWSFLFHDLFNKKLHHASPPFEMVKEQYFNDNVCNKCGA